MRKLQLAKPAQVRLAPTLLARIVQLMPQQKPRNLLPLGPQILDRRAARPGQITHGLMPLIGHPHRGQRAGAQQLRQTERIAPVGLHPIPRLPGNERSRNNQALMPKALDLPIQSIPGRPRLVAERQPLVLARKLLHQLRRRRRAVLDHAEKPHRACPPAFRNRNRMAQLRTIKSHISFAIISHDSPSLLEALPGLSG
jgi:hypothetical protein